MSTRKYIRSTQRSRGIRKPAIESTQSGFRKQFPTYLDGGMANNFPKKHCLVDPYNELQSESCTSPIQSDMGQTTSTDVCMDQVPDSGIPNLYELLYLAKLSAQHSPGAFSDGTFKESPSTILSDETDQTTFRPWLPDAAMHDNGDWYKQDKASSPELSKVSDGLDSDLLACPFHKLDPQLYHGCSKYELRRIKDVKQHIQRKHMSVGNEPSCPQCSKALPILGLQTCNPEVDHSESCPHCRVRIVTKKKFADLNTLSQAKTREDKWFKFWDALFPDRVKPRSCFMGHYMENMVAWLRKFWENKDLEIIANMKVNTKGADDLGNEILRGLFESFLHYLEVEVKGTAVEGFTIVLKSPSQQNLESPNETHKSSSRDYQSTAMKGEPELSWANCNIFDQPAYVKPIDTILYQI